MLWCLVLCGWTKVTEILSIRLEKQSLGSDLVLMSLKLNKSNKKPFKLCSCMPLFSHISLNVCTVGVVYPEQQVYHLSAVLHFLLHYYISWAITSRYVLGGIWGKKRLFMSYNESILSFSRILDWLSVTTQKKNMSFAETKYLIILLHW